MASKNALNTFRTAARVEREVIAVHQHVVDARKRTIEQAAIGRDRRE